MKKQTISEVAREMGRRGGKKSLETMTPEERTARAKYASAKSVAAMTPVQRTARAKKAAAASAKARKKTAKKA
jgi:hypothetical protein